MENPSQEPLPMEVSDIVFTPASPDDLPMDPWCPSNKIWGYGSKKCPQCKDAYLWDEVNSVCFSCRFAGGKPIASECLAQEVLLKTPETRRLRMVRRRLAILDLIEDALSWADEDPEMEGPDLKKMRRDE